MGKADPPFAMKLSLLALLALALAANAAVLSKREEELVDAIANDVVNDNSANLENDVEALNELEKDDGSKPAEGERKGRGPRRGGKSGERKGKGERKEKVMELGEEMKELEGAEKKMGEN